MEVEDNAGLEHAKENVLGTVEEKDLEELKKHDLVYGMDYNKEDLTVDEVLENFLHIGFSATQYGRAVNEIRKMLKWRLSDEPYDENLDYPEDLEERKKIRCKIFLGLTSNMISCGLREIIRFLVQHKMVDVIVTTCGGIEEDLIKCWHPTYVGEYHLRGKDLRSKNINRIGNLLVPNDNYCDFEDWIIPVFDECLKRQNEECYHWTPSRLIWKLGEAINNESSFVYWAAKNHIPVFCPAITDGSIGDMLFFHSHQQLGLGLQLDIVGDIRAMNQQAINSPKNAAIILGGGIPKHHIMNANLFAGTGLAFSVNINTGMEFEGSDSGASPDEAVSWGKISPEATPVKVPCDASIIFPLIVMQTFRKEYFANKKYWDEEKVMPEDPHESYLSQVENNFF